MTRVRMLLGAEVAAELSRRAREAGADESAVANALIAAVLPEVLAETAANALAGPGAQASPAATEALALRQAGESLSAKALRELAESVQDVAVRLGALVPALLADASGNPLAEAVNQVAVLCAIQARAIDPARPGLADVQVWQPESLEQLLDLAQLALTLAERDLTNRPDTTAAAPPRPK